VRTVHVHEVEASALREEVDQHALGVAHQLADARGVHQGDVGVEHRLEPRVWQVLPGDVLRASLERVDAGDVRVPQAPEDVARGHAFETADLERSSAAAVEFFHHRLPRRHVLREPVARERAALDDLAAEARAEVVARLRGPRRLRRRGGQGDWGRAPHHGRDPA
jgi:hypothetical protein